MANPTTIIQGDPSTKVDLVASTTITANGNGSALVGAGFYTAFLALLDVTSVGGTGPPTLDVYIQTQLPNSTDWTDLAAFTRMTAIGQRVIGYVAGGNSEFSVSSGTLAGGTFRTIPIGSTIRALYAVGGASPSFTFSVSMELYV